jgi:tripartite ATP-independent transporter DctP family solute receptor
MPRVPRCGAARLLSRAPLVVAAIALACVGLAGCGGGDGGEVWRFAIEEIEGRVQHAYAARFETRVEQRTQGSVQVEVYPYGSLGTSTDLTEQVQRGALQLAFASPGHLGSVVPEAQVFSLHYVLSDDEAVNHAILSEKGRFRELLGEAYAERRLALLAILPEGWMVWTANRPLRAPADFRGLKMRTMVSPLLVAAYAAYGADPTPMPYAEVYSGLQLGMIDAQVNPVFAVEEMSFHEVQSDLVFAHHAPFVTTLVADPEFLAALPPARRALLEEVVEELDPWIFEVQQRLNRERLRRIEAEGGTRIARLGDAEREAFRALSVPVRDTYRDLAGPRGGEILEALLARVAAADAGANGR